MYIDFYIVHKVFEHFLNPEMILIADALAEAMSMNHAVVFSALHDAYKMAGDMEQSSMYFIKGEQAVKTVARKVRQQEN